MRSITAEQYRRLLGLYNRYLDVIRVKPESKGEAEAVVAESKAVKKRIEEYTRRLGIE